MQPTFSLKNGILRIHRNHPSRKAPVTVINPVGFSLGYKWTNYKLWAARGIKKTFSENMRLRGHKNRMAREQMAAAEKNARGVLRNN